MHIVDDNSNKENTAIEKLKVPELDAILGKKFPVLDKGFVRVIDYMGNDSSIVQAARVSYGSGTKTSREDQGLINFLFRHRHTSPFEMCEIKFHIKMPLFIARQWIRHRTASLNEMSARYSVIPEDYYVPEIDQCRMQSTTNKQSGNITMDSDVAANARDQISNSAAKSFENYKSLLDQKLAREISRVVLPQNMYTELYWKIDLHNLFHLLSLRSKAGAQYEIRVYAETILEEIVKIWVPFAYEAFKNYREGSVSFSKKQMDELSTILDEEKVKVFIEKYKNDRGEMREMATLLEEISIQNK